MLEQQSQETDFDTRRVANGDSALDSRSTWAVLPLPTSSVKRYAVSSRQRDFAPDDWLITTAFGADPMWLAD